jgi:hypothetical protein
VSKIQNLITFQEPGSAIGKLSSAQNASLAWDEPSPVTSSSRINTVCPSSTSAVPQSIKLPRGLRITDGSERHFGPTSLVSLMYEMKETVLLPLRKTESGNSIASDKFSAALAAIELLGSEEGQLDVVPDVSSPAIPPLFILKAMIDPYFDQINPYFPIWSKNEFGKIVTATYTSGETPQNIAHAVCCNSLVLLTLDTESLRSSVNNGSRLTLCKAALTAELKLNFLSNAKRAITNARSLALPRLVNLQALISLVCITFNLCKA